MKDFSRNEYERLLSLSNLEIDYSELESEFGVLTEMASKITNMDVTLINLVDSLTQWTVARHGFQISSMPREECICHYTIAGTDYFEVEDLTADDRFKNMTYVRNAPHLRYYFGIPLVLSEGVNIGTICVMDRENKKLSPEKIELFKLIGKELTNKFKAFHTINILQHDLSDAIKMQRKITHNLRDPLAGIIGISDLIIDENETHTDDEINEFVNLINSSSKSILEIADSVFAELNNNQLEHYSTFNLQTLAERISQHFMPLAKGKEITLNLKVNPDKHHIPFSRKKILQTIVTPVSSVIKLSRSGTEITIDLDLSVKPDGNILHISVNSKTPKETHAMPGSSLLNLTKELVENMNGEFEYRQNQEEGLTYRISLPQAN
ncbi:GAF domain-containing sensor histidine kinase [Daejeonella sp. H1SJ63]|uniref:GAF domain-containing sensor histidine kinase n=1 Tax=Daejeonella sp. H1SJ63 TaxID=3034145 RepID=UPI0023EC41DB|nr:GAF domain-containing sensor histidine kinase [Daejeonella sp. H1SJ63]